MKITDAFVGVHRLFLDTAPVIYYAERHPIYFGIVEPFFSAISDARFTAITSPVTLIECLVLPLRRGLVRLQQHFEDLVVYGEHTEFVDIDLSISHRAAELRAQHNLSLPDALQCATALAHGCDALLTNDSDLKRVTQLRVLVIDELEP